MVGAVGGQVTQFGSMTVFNYPSGAGRVSQFGVMATAEGLPPPRVSQFGAMVVVRGRVADPQLKVWTFPLDGHEMYVLRVGDTETLVFDTYSAQWSVWGSGSSPRWRAKTGCFWQGGGAAAGGYGTSIVVGDETFGTLYFLDPLYPYDDDPQTGADDATSFHRVVQGQIAHRGRTPIDCFGVQITGSFGDVISGSLTAVTLSISDDAGRSYADAGTVDVAVEDYAARVEWRSLGIIKSPGRLFKLEDDGALARIDSMDMMDD